MHSHNRFALGSLLVAVITTVGSCQAYADGPTRWGGIAASGAPLPITTVADYHGWTGCYVGGAVGYSWNRTEFDQAGPGGDKIGERAINADDIMLSPYAGCDVQASNIVLGVMGDVTWSDLGGRAADGSLDADYQWFVGARAGVLLTPKTLAYGLVGYTELDGGLSFDFDDATSLGDLSGLTYGGGLEYAVGGGWTSKLEYRYVQFDSDTAPSGAIDGVVDGSDIDTGAHQVRLGVSYRFPVGR